MTTLLPAHKQRAAANARRLEWLTLAARASVIGALVLVTQSQGVQALWIKNILALLPPVAFLCVTRLEARPANARFPYGLARANIVVHLFNGLLLLVLAAYLEFTALSHLAGGKAPSPGSTQLAGLSLWSGWVVLAALVYASGVAIALSHLRAPLAAALHDKTLYADTVIGRAEWHCAAAAGVGLVGVHAGLWWADAVATALIGLQVIYFGWRTSMQAARDLVDERPRLLGSCEIDPLPEHIRDTLLALAWISHADVRLREQGRWLAGDASITVSDTADLPARIQAATRQVQALDWRLHDFVISPVPAR